MKKLVAATLMGMGGAFLVGVMGQSASAQVVCNSPAYLGKHSNVNFYSQPCMDTVYRLADQTTTTGSNVPAGWMGARAVMYYANGSKFCTQSSMTYNTYTASIWNATAPLPSTCLKGTYYFSKGEGACWNGDGYSVYITYQSPNALLS